jgi:hypothetical protein
MDPDVPKITLKLPVPKMRNFDLYNNWFISQYVTSIGVAC